MDRSFKMAVWNESRSLLMQKIDHLTAQMRQYQEAANEETKSSAGDKYETGRAMMHLEKEKIAGQINNLARQLQVLDQIRELKDQNQVELGSLVVTNHGVFFLAIGLGAIEVEKKSVFVLSPVSPIGNLMMGKKKGDTFSFNQRTYELNLLL